MASQAHNLKGFWPLDSGAEITYLKVAATQTLTKGDAVILSIGSGLVSIGLAASAELCGVIAQDSVLQASGTLVAVYANPNEKFIGNADADSSASVAGAYVDLVGATGAMLLDVGLSVTDVFTLVAPYDSSEALATANARWICQINKHAFAETSA